MTEDQVVYYHIFNVKFSSLILFHLFLYKVYITVNIELIWIEIFQQIKMH